MTTPIEGLADAEMRRANITGELDKPLDMTRVKQKPGGGHDYLPEHDVIRTANRIFGFGQWGTEVVELEMVGQHQVKNSKGDQGWYVGYRCTVRLTVAGCVPVCGVGYGDAFEKQWSAVVTAHELACKEAESDAIKRAFKKYGDQFGLVLYAKDGDRYAIMAAAQEREQENAEATYLEEGDRWATDDELKQLGDTALTAGGEDLQREVRAWVKAQMDAVLEATGIGKRIPASRVGQKMVEVMQKGGLKDADVQRELGIANPTAAQESAARLAAAGFQPPAGAVVTDGTPEAEQQVNEAAVAEAFKDAA